MLAEQMSFLAEIDEKEVRKLVTRDLKNYRVAKVQLENKKECNEAGMTPFPTLRDSSNINELKVKQIERALEHALDDIEREIITRKYLSTSRVKDINIYMDLNINKDPYYELKRRAINTIAEALGII
ncbi:ArpU family transcriptional regulator [Neobacillus sp. MM2021_6]|uniref:ArpU family phage packaging/lysis transcriptional regulator n=1 Tax=Bacillaceae TaxID=186817 RepID=UPI00140C4A78|nr:MULTISPECIES: ArpU family phage packaging/lysis transcriptional regulator [Bacillaceae]MBO0962509.1 ArpU family transcriptional regulator [Neobacillus sp. MM2021_6]NHC21298.1 ArpU family transcriptional regulator [Bacillus sp. MM2020_4]